MRVRMLKLVAGPDGVFQPGAEMVVVDKDGLEMIQRGYAVPIPEKREVEAVAPQEVRQASAKRRARIRKESTGGVE